MAKNSHHVVPAPNGGWNVKKWGAERASKHFEKKEDAVKWGQEISKSQGTERLSGNLFAPLPRDHAASLR
jgi:Uncharacterized protein conserved in bacteria (DUF2188)